MANLTHTDDHEFGRVYTISDAHTPSMKRAPRTRTKALSDCVCYDRDGNVIRTIARATSTPRKRTTRTTTRVSPAQRRDIILQASMGSIHEGDS